MIKSSVIILCLLMLSISAHAKTKQEIVEKVKGSKAYKELKIKSKKQKLLRVVVKPTSMPAYTTKEERKSVLKNRVKRLGDVDNDLKKLGFRAEKSMMYSGQLVYELDAKKLDTFVESGLVDMLGEDVLLAPNLVESTIMIGSDYTNNDGFSGQGYAVAILDTGVDNDHPEFGNRVVEEACFSTNSTYATSLCLNSESFMLGLDSADDCMNLGIWECEHGTHVAGIAAGSNGVAPQANIVAVQVFSLFTDAGTCGLASQCLRTYTSDYQNAMGWILYGANTQNIVAINMSLGGGLYTTDSECASRDVLDVETTINNLQRSGIVSVIASGNDGSGSAVAYPGCLTNALTVGSTLDTSNVLSSFSNRNSMIDLLAPGSNITSAIPGGAFGVKSGTSMAAPHVTGSIAVMKSKFPDASILDIEYALKRTGVSIFDDGSGLIYPRLDLYTAVNKPMYDPSEIIMVVDNVLR